MAVQRGDWVAVKGWREMWQGTVRRLAQDGSWADVAWRDGGSKRMRTDKLEVLHTITSGDWQITDLTRERELKAQES